MRPSGHDVAAEQAEAPLDEFALWRSVHDERRDCVQRLLRERRCLGGHPGRVHTDVFELTLTADLPPRWRPLVAWVGKQLVSVHAGELGDQIGGAEGRRRRS